MTVSIPRSAICVATLALYGATTRAAAAPPPAPPTTQAASAQTGGDAATPWRSLATPRRNMFELGVFGGVWAPPDDLELHFRELPFQPFEARTGELGARVGYYPLRHFGFEGEVAMMPTRTRSQQRAFVSTARAHAVFQLGLYRIVPFVLIGGGVMRVRSEPSAVGNDSDQVFTVGGGLKYLLTPRLQLRLEVRDTMAPKRGRGVNDPADTLEVLAGFSVLLGPRKRAAPSTIVADTDGDGLLDNEDQCVHQIGVAPDGCPVRDSDQDGFSDKVDACPDEAGAAADGCPIPDSDADGFLDPSDDCPREAGVAPRGCPIRDIDNDGLLAPADQCPEQPEVPNGFEDSDGCPDTLPETTKPFTGVVDGIDFAPGKAKLRAGSAATLAAAAKVLAQYPDLRVEISAHTDNVGKSSDNGALSAARAGAVRQVLIEAGIAADRIVARGAGPSEPIEDNRTKTGRAANRRVEFKWLVPETTAPSSEIEPPTTD